MNVQPKLRIESEHGETEVIGGPKSIAIFQDGAEVLLTESETRQLYDWLGRAFSATGDK